MKPLDWFDERALEMIRQGTTKADMYTCARVMRSQHDRDAAIVRTSPPYAREELVADHFARWGKHPCTIQHEKNTLD